MFSLQKSIVGSLKLRRCLLCNLDLGDFSLAVVTQAGNQNHMTNRIGIQAVAKLQLVNIGSVGLAQIGGIVGNRGSGLAADAPAPGNKRRAVRCIVGGVLPCVVGAGGIERTAGVGCGGQVVIYGNTIANIFAGIDRLAVGHTVCITCVKGILIAPTIHGLLADPNGIIQIIRTGYDVVL